MATVEVHATPNDTFEDQQSNTPETTIDAGDAVKWVNVDSDEHTLVSDNVSPFDTLTPPFNGENIPGSPTGISRTFDRARNYGYHCGIHGGNPGEKTGMYGIVHVRSRAGSAQYLS